MLTLFSALLISLASAPQDAPPQADSKPATKPVKPAKICRSVLVTGSRVPIRTCKTAEQWAQPTPDGNAKLFVQDRGNGDQSTVSAPTPQ